MDGEVHSLEARIAGLIRPAMLTVTDERSAWIAHLAFVAVARALSEDPDRLFDFGFCRDTHTGQYGRIDQMTTSRTPLLPA